MCCHIPAKDLKEPQIIAVFHVPNHLTGLNELPTSFGSCTGVGFRNIRPRMRAVILSQMSK